MTTKEACDLARRVVAADTWLFGPADAEGICLVLLALAAENTALRSHPPLSAEEREALGILRGYIVERDGEYVLDLRGGVLPRAIALLDRLLAASETQGEK